MLRNGFVAQRRPKPETFDVDLKGRRAPATLGTMACTCRGIDNPHVHYFIESPAFKQLSAGDEVDIDLDPATRTLRVERRPV